MASNCAVKLFQTQEEVISDQKQEKMTTDTTTTTTTSTNDNRSDDSNFNGDGNNSGNGGSSNNVKLRDTLRKEFVGRLLDRNQTLIEKLTKKGETSLKELCQQQLPSNSQDVRTKLPFYQSIYEQLQYQRDTYLVGTEYADQRKIERKEEEEDRKVYDQYRRQRRRRRRQQQQQQFGGYFEEDDDGEEDDDFHSFQQRQRLLRLRRRLRQGRQALSSSAAAAENENEDDDTPIVNIQSWNTVLQNQYRIPFSSTALGHVQLVNIGQWFLPSATMKGALLPIVVDLPLGGLYNVALTATVNSIPLGQPIVDRALKNALINFMSNPYWRQIIKNQSTKGIMMSSSTSTNSTSTTATTTTTNTTNSSSTRS